jgi:hypothetical protein
MPGVHISRYEPPEPACGLLALRNLRLRAPNRLHARGKTTVANRTRAPRRVPFEFFTDHYKQARSIIDFGRVVRHSEVAPDFSGKSLCQFKTKDEQADGSPLDAWLARRDTDDQAGRLAREPSSEDRSTAFQKRFRLPDTKGA